VIKNLKYENPQEQSNLPEIIQKNAFSKLQDGIFIFVRKKYYFLIYPYPEKNGGKKGINLPKIGVQRKLLFSPDERNKFIQTKLLTEITHEYLEVY